MNKVTRPKKLVRIETNSTGDCREYVYEDVLTEFLTVTQFLLKNRKIIKQLQSQETFFYFSPGVKKAKKHLRLQFRNEERKYALTHYDGIPLIQIVYSNPIIQIFFEFALCYADLNKTNGRPFSFEKAKTAFERAFQESLKLKANKNQRQSRKAARKIVGFTFQMQPKFQIKDLKMLEKGRKEGSTKLTKEKERLSRLGLKPRQIVDILFPSYAPDQKKREARLISRLLYKKRKDANQKTLKNSQKIT